jgi:hypothetical protein
LSESLTAGSRGILIAVISIAVAIMAMLMSFVFRLMHHAFSLQFSFAIHIEVSLSTLLPFSVVLSVVATIIITPTIALPCLSFPLLFTFFILHALSSQAIVLFLLKPPLFVVVEFWRSITTMRIRNSVTRVSVPVLSLKTLVTTTGEAVLTVRSDAESSSLNARIWTSHAVPTLITSRLSALVVVIRIVSLWRQW